MDVFKDLLHANQFIVEFVIGAGVGEEGVSICDKQIEDLHHLCKDRERRAPYSICMHIVSAYSESGRCYVARTGLDRNDKDVELWQQVFLAGGKELE